MRFALCIEHTEREVRPNIWEIVPRARRFRSPKHPFRVFLKPKGECVFVKRMQAYVEPD